MAFWEIMVIGIGLGMDAVYMSINDSTVYKDITNRQGLTIPLTFGLFHGAMSLVGFTIGRLLFKYVGEFQGVILFIALGVIGATMLKAGLSSCDEVIQTEDAFYFKLLMLQAFLTSINAFGAGMAIGAAGVASGLACVVFAICAFALCYIAFMLGKKRGNKHGKRCEILGAFLLIGIAIKLLFKFTY